MLTEGAVAARVLAGYNEDTSSEENSGNFGFGEEHAIDDVAEIHSRYPLIEDADSSQHSALIDAIDGKNLVIEGPPGTGKSQTITNLIAAAMAQGKRVLFVAEKMAALDVVQRRLDSAGLGDFCLELHSHKSQKRKIIDDVNSRLGKRGSYRAPDEIMVDIDRYEELKTELRAYVERINSPWRKTGRTVHEIFMAATRFRQETGLTPDRFHPVGYDGETLDPATRRRLEDSITAFADVYSAIEDQLPDETVVQNHPWFGVTNGDLQLFDLERVDASLLAWQNALERLGAARELLRVFLSCSGDLLPEVPEELEAFENQLSHLPRTVNDAHLEALTKLEGTYLDDARKHLDQIQSIQGLYAELSGLIDPILLDDLQSVDIYLEGSDKLKVLVGNRVDLGRLAEAIQRLRAIEQQLGELQEPVEAVAKAIGGPAGELLSLSENGLREFRVLVSLVSALEPVHVSERSPLFDNDQLDQILPNLHTKLEVLTHERRRLESLFRIDDLPDAETLRQLRSRLDVGGLFRWLKSDWRDARKELLSYAASRQVNFPSLVGELESAAMYAEQCDAFLKHKDYQEALGSNFQGMDTLSNKLISLREWYRSVRSEYGVGFGKRVVVGDALFSLPDVLVRAIRSLSERGVQRRIEDLLDDLNSLKKIFSPVKSLQESHTLLGGVGGVIPALLRDLDDALSACRPLVGDNSISIEDVAVRAEKIATLQSLQSSFEASSLDQELFNGSLRLVSGRDRRDQNEAGIIILKATIAVAETLNENGIPDVVVDYIRAHPTTETFEAVHEFAHQLAQALQGQKSTLSTYAALVGLDWAQWTSNSDHSVRSLIARNDRALKSPNFLQNWLDYVRVKQQIQRQGLGASADALEAGEVSAEYLRDAHLAGVYDLLAREIFRENPHLQRFSGQSQQSLQKQFRRYDESLKSLQRERIAWAIDQNQIPMGNVAGRVSERTELGLLQHVAGQQRPRVTLRQLLRSAGNALTSLKPCFMMSPMSVAQYLAPGGVEFDLVVMDEASQIKPQDALGALARGKQLVVVGDPKQMPPSSLFERLISDGDGDADPTAIEETESILDAALPMFPARRLRWHYRSQHQELIAFSNQFFYDNDLILFPSPHNDVVDFGIKFVPLARGCFVNKRNLEEARVIAEAVREHARHHPDETLGVVSMSAEQQAQIEQAIEVAAKEDLIFQNWLERGAAGHEALFIKNLENVQGDERDVIYISMTYGPQDPGGRVMQRFGLINQDAGWRRLNVLFTRSRKRMHVFSSMRAEDIVIGSSSKRGVRALRDFLAFCETKNLHATIPDTGRPPDSDFEIAVANALRAEGFECIPQVGVSGFFIDIAVVDPGNPGRYLMGVECDGATYHSAKSVRDRDRLRQAVLERLGWRIRRIWSTDWFKNPDALLQPIIRELHALKSEPVEPIQSSTGSPEEEFCSDEESIADIVERVEHDVIETDILVASVHGLSEQLMKLDEELIRKQYPDTPEANRLLRPAMLEALIEYQPTDKYEFLQVIPSYLRLGTHAEEGKFLNQVFEIINANQDE